MEWVTFMASKRWIFPELLFIILKWINFSLGPTLFVSKCLNQLEGLAYADYADYANGSGLDLSLPKFAVAGLVDTTKPDKGHDFSSIPLRPGR